MEEEDLKNPGDCKFELKLRLNIETEESLHSQITTAEQCEDTINTSSSSTIENLASSQVDIRSSDNCSEQSLLIVKIKEEPFHLVDYDTDGTTDDENEDNTKNNQQAVSSSSLHLMHYSPAPAAVCTSNKVQYEDIWNEAIMGSVASEKPDKVDLPLPAFFHDYGRKESTDSSDSDSDSSDSTVSVLSVESGHSSSDTNW